jgi:hypothetical protein
MVAVGPAHNDDVHVGSASFWGPWAIVALLCAGLVVLMSALRARREGAPQRG